MVRTKKKTLLAQPLSLNAASEGEEAEGGMLLEREDIQVIYKALRAYTPTEKEAQRYDILVEQFEEHLMAEYIEIAID